MRTKDLFLVMMGCALIIFALAGCGTKEPGAIRPFNGKDFTGWQVKGGDWSKAKWHAGLAAVSEQYPNILIVKQGSGEMINAAKHHNDSIDIYTNEKFGDCLIELEVMVPKGSNSGIYVMGEYEIQVLDSYGVKELKPSDMGAVFGAAVPTVNASKKPGEWQKYVIDFRAPKFDEQGKKIANAKMVKVELNGQVLHENLDLPNLTASGVTGKESESGPLMFQGNHGPVAYRNIKITRLSGAE